MLIIVKLNFVKIDGGDGVGDVGGDGDGDADGVEKQETTDMLSTKELEICFKGFQLKSKTNHWP